MYIYIHMYIYLFAQQPNTNVNRNVNTHIHKDVHTDVHNMKSTCLRLRRGFSSSRSRCDQRWETLFIELRLDVQKLWGPLGPWGCGDVLEGCLYTHRYIYIYNKCQRGPNRSPCPNRTWFLLDLHGGHTGGHTDPESNSQSCNSLGPNLSEG